MVRRLVLYPLPIAVFPILSLYAHNVRLAPPGVLGVPIALAVAATLVLWVPLGLWLRDAHRSGMLVALAWGLFYASGRVTEVLEAALWGLSRLWVYHPGRRLPEAPGIVLMMGLFGVLAYRAARMQSPRSWTAPLNLFALALVVLPTIQILRATPWERAPREVACEPLPTASWVEARPDVYYIILDGFARADVLEEIYGVDGEPMLRALEDRGFSVARRSTANYNQTRLSLASSLNARYLDDLYDPNLIFFDAVVQPLIGQGAVVGALDRLGYRFVSFATGYDLTEIRSADRYLSPDVLLGQFHRMLVLSTPLRSLLPAPIARDAKTLARELTLFALEELPRVARLRGPTFTFAHIVAPHPPFVFGADGGPATPDLMRLPGFADGNHFPGTPEQYVSGYRDQARFIGRRVLETIDAILDASPEPPIIILQSDHGPGSRMNHEDPARSDLKERMGILNAYLLPGVDRDVIDDRITPVNTFRVVFNAYFGAELDRLPDRNYVAAWGTPFAFVDVTDEIQGQSR